MKEQRSNLYLLTGLLIGLFLGLLYAWVISPVKYTDTNPSALDDTYKDEYRRVIALAYQANGNLDRARQRLALLNNEGSVQMLAAQAQRMLADNSPPQESRAVAILAADLGRSQDSISASPSAQPVAKSTGTAPVSPLESTPGLEADLFTATHETVIAVQTPTLPPPTRTATVTRTALPTFTPRPTATPLPVLDAPFILKEKREVCDGSVPEGLVRVQVNDANGNPLPGVKIVTTWQAGEDVFFTGFVPTINPGYADFKMDPATLYSLQVGMVSDVIDNLAVGSCKGGWDLTFEESS